ncbi:F-box/kelch-repeat protein At1g26930-like [Rutidosis leptorrhynchoides]|uniref:F-box/kelch-repeat protein At1g26930-like n=1 Tax=Rutidosis leptorrhynchoides TaxID=125765 RepID=UPI003A9A3CF5
MEDGIEKLAFNLQNMRFENFSTFITCPRYYYASIASLNNTFRDLVESGEIYEQRRECRVTEHWVHFSCEMLKWEAFDPVTKNWIDMPIINADKCFELSDKESLGVGTQLLVLGKEMFGQVIYKYSLLTNSWSPQEPMRTPRCLFGSGSLGKIAIFAGGVSLTSGKTVDYVESYNSETGAWEMLPSLLKPRKMSSGVVMDGKFYVIGGSDGIGKKAMMCGEEYDPISKKWRHVPNMSPGGGADLMAPPLLAVIDNQLYAANCAEMVVKKYDKVKNVWANIGPLPRADSMNGWGIAFRGCGDRVIIVGGSRKQGGSHLAIYSWVPSKGPPEWTIIGHKRTNNFVYNCAIMGC